MLQSGNKFGIILSCFFLIFMACSGLFSDDSEKILENYAQILRAFNREDLHGVMKYIAEDFHSNIKEQRTYDEIKTHRRLFILEHSNILVEFRNLNISIKDSDATVSYQINLRTNKLRESWNQTDTLHKSRGKWKIISSVITEEM